MKYDPTPPPDELVEWAEKVLPKLVSRPFKHVWDRGWHRTPPPPPMYKSFNFPCVCKRRNVLVQSYPCNGDRQELFIGQCDRRGCGSVLWCIKDK